jgi:hypothetical protein
MDDILIDAQMLAAFSNLTREQVGEFRNAIAPDFLPSSLWEMTRIESEVFQVWQVIQRKVQEAWAKRFPLDLSIQLITDTDRFSSTAQSLERASRMSNQEISNMSLPMQEVWPFQRAVMFLAVNSWRARFCLRCGKRFVATKPKSTYCSDECSSESRKGTKRAWWGSHGEEWRSGKKRATAKRSKKGAK